MTVKRKKYLHPALGTLLNDEMACPEGAQKATKYASRYRTLTAAVRAALKAKKWPVDLEWFAKTAAPASEHHIIDGPCGWAECPSMLCIVKRAPAVAKKRKAATAKYALLGAQRLDRLELKLKKREGRAKP